MRYLPDERFAESQWQVLGSRPNPAGREFLYGKLKKAGELNPTGLAIGK
jgi:hypothetical protein